MADAIGDEDKTVELDGASETSVEHGGETVAAPEDAGVTAPLEREQVMAANTAATVGASEGEPSRRGDSKSRKKGLLARVVAVVAACVVVFCGCSAYAYSQGNDPLAFLSGDVFATVASDDADAAEAEGDADDAAQDEEASEQDEETSDQDEEAADESDAEDAVSEDDGEAPDSALSGSSSADSSGSSSSSSSSSGSSAGTSFGSGTSSSSGSSSGGSSSGSSGSSSSSGSSGSSSSSSQASTITVSVTIDASAGGGSVSTTSVSLDAGATVYAALLATGAQVNASFSSMGAYVASINGLAEFDCGSNSGWLYSVNGVDPSVGCSNYTLSDGDVVRWHYTADYTQE